MCDQNTMDELENTVKEFLNEGRMFTGYDVTIATRNRIRKKINHLDVRADIHEITALKDAIDYGWDTPQVGTVKWIRTRFDMPNQQWAWVFHPTNVDPLSYQPRDSSGNVLSISQVVVTPQKLIPSISTVNDGASNDSGGLQDDGTFTTDYRGRLLIRTEFLREAGLNPANKAFVAANCKTNTLMIANTDTGFNDPDLKVTSQLIEKSGEIRISEKTLNSADITEKQFLVTNCDYVPLVFRGSVVKIVKVVAAPVKVTPASTN